MGFGNCWIIHVVIRQTGRQPQSFYWLQCVIAITCSPVIIVVFVFICWRLEKKWGQIRRLDVGHQVLGVKLSALKTGTEDQCLNIALKNLVQLDGINTEVNCVSDINPPQFASGRRVEAQWKIAGHLPRPISLQDECVKTLVAELLVVFQMPAQCKRVNSR